MNSIANLDKLFLQARQLLAQGSADRAVMALNAMLAIRPTDARAYLLLAGIAYAQDRLRDATRFALLASENPLPDANFLANLIMGLLQAGEVTMARKCLSHPAIEECRDGSILARLSSAQQMIGEHAAALALIERAFANNFDNPDLRYLHSVQLTFNGHLEQAERELEKGLQQGTLRGRSFLTLARMRKQTADANHLAQIRSALQKVQHGSEDHAAIEFALYKESEDVGDYTSAWSALDRANTIMHKRLHHDAAGESRKLDQLIAGCTRLAPTVAVADNQAQPIFIVGMPRSGTTLLDRLLGSHPMVESAGELADFARQLRWAADLVTTQALDPLLLERLPGIDLAEIGRRYLAQTRWRAHGKSRYVDKLPANYFWLGLIAQALPDARILHLVRDPMDVCFSNYRAYFGGGYAYSYDLTSLASHYRDYRRLMTHWHEAMPDRILDVRYDELVADPESVMRGVFAFCDLPEMQDVGNLASNYSPVATLSSMQVRSGIDRDTGGQWRRYAEQLSPLAELIADL